MVRGKSPNVSNKNRDSFIPKADLEATLAQISQNDVNLRKKRVTIVEQPQRVLTTYQKLLDNKSKKPSLKPSPIRKKQVVKKKSVKTIEPYYHQKIFSTDESTIMQDSYIPNYQDAR